MTTTLIEIVARTNLTPEVLADLAERFGVKSLAVFGSVLRADFDEGSDVDLVVEVAGHGTTFDVICGLESALEAITGRKVDLLTKDQVTLWMENRNRRDEILATAVVVYGTW